jgi:peroxiredoxin
MKKITTLFLAITFTLVAIAQKNLELKNPKPTPGSVITFEYMPRNTVLQGVKDFEATAYLFEGSMPRAVEIPLKQEGGIFRGSVNTADTTKAVFFAFGKDEKHDNNNDEGYYTPMFDKGGKVAMGAYTQIASAFNGLGNYLFGLKRNQDKVAELNKIEFADAKVKEKLFFEYVTYLSQSKNEEDKALLKTEMEKKLADKNLSENDLLRIKGMYEFSLKEKEKAEAVGATLKERFPNGQWKRSEMQNSFYKAKTIEEKEKILQEFVATYAKPGKEEQQILDNMYSSLSQVNTGKADYEKAKKYALLVKSNDARANTLNSLAWALAGEGINKKPVDVKTGLELSALSLAAMKSEKKEMSNKPPYFTAKQYVARLDGSYYNFVDTYATLLFHNGNYDEALKMEKEAVEYFKRKNTDMNEAFAALTEKVKGSAAAQKELEAFLEEGKYSPAMKEQLQRLYTSGGKTTAEWTAYVGGIEEKAYNKLKEEIARTMINMPAPQFALKDLNGNSVSLASLKGKIVVVDFWATWCGPCIASFPAMQTAVNKFKDNPNVVFLFIDTWENDSNRVQKVTDFIAKNKYNFQVLYDETKTKESDEFAVVQNFGVEGIPTKFVIDRNNNIRFKTVGYNGSLDATVAELTTMIDMAAAASGEPFKKAF